MASGKQLSFQNGEVSPSQRYKSDAVSYSQGLSKLRNMFVRRDGGVSNRTGLQLVKHEALVAQTNIPEVGGAPGIQGFTFWSPEAAKWVTIEYALRDGEYSFVVDDGAPLVGTPFPIVGPTPDKIRFTVLKDKVFITPQLELSNGSTYNVAIPFDGSAIEYDYGFLKSVTFNGGASTVGYSGKAPFLPVSYLIMAEMKDGTERMVTYFQSLDIPNPDIAPATGVVHPHAEMVSKITLVFDTAPTDVKLFKLYRAAGNGGLASASYALAGQSRYDGATLSLKFEDYGASSPAITPPIDTASVYMGALRGVNAAAYYQQRLLMAMEPGTGAAGNGVPENFKSGDMLVSKVGAPEQIIPPIIYADAGAFQCSVPTSDGTPVIAYLSMERSIAMTERGTYILRGGEQGILTPTSVNPLSISKEGSSKIVEPKMAGTRGYFINSAHNKLMAIEFGADSNLKVYEASLLSNHLLKQDVVQMEVMGGGEDSVFVLRRDGKLVQITVGEDGTHGFSLLETDGYIESIYKARYKREYSPNAVDAANKEIYYDALMCYVIRNGDRRLERLMYREDEYREGEFFADSYISFGQRLATNGSEGYKRIVVGTDMVPINDGVKINLEAVAGWTAGETINIRCSEVIPSTSYLAEFVLHFYYEEAGVVKAIRFIFDSLVPVVDGTDRIYPGYFEQDVPESLQDVAAQATLTTAEKNRRQTRWLPAVKNLSNLSGGPLVALYSAGGGYTGTPSVPLTIVGDGEILSSPLNPYRETIELARNPDTLNLELFLPDYCAWGYIGIPYTSEFETLDLEAGDNRTLTNAKKLISSVGLGLMETRGGFFGTPDKELTEMSEIVLREEGEISLQTQNKNGYIEVAIPSEWTVAGRVSIKNVDPVPMTILSIYPKGLAGD